MVSSQGLEVSAQAWERDVDAATERTSKGALLPHEGPVSIAFSSA